MRQTLILEGFAHKCKSKCKSVMLQQDCDATAPEPRQQIVPPLARRVLAHDGVPDELLDEFGLRRGWSPPSITRRKLT
jgi:hypothetical protein